MSNKYIFFTDFHAHVWTEFSAPDEEFVNTRVKEQINVLEQVFELAEEHNADLIFGGDMFHQRGKVDTRVLNLMFRTIADNMEANPGLTLHMIPGNHDKVTNSLHSPSSIDIFGAIDRVEVYTEPTKVDNLFNEVSLFMVPYGDETEEIKDWLEGATQQTSYPTTILVGHLGVEGSSTGKSSHRLGGAFSYGDLHPDYFQYILLGHYHKRQLLGDGTNHKHIYGGSVMQNTFSDEGQTKGVHLLTIEEDSDNNTIEYIEIPSTLFRTVNASNLPNNLDEIMSKSFVRFQGDSSQVKALENVSEDLTNVRVEVERDYSVQTRINIDTSSSPEQIVKEYASEYYPNAVEASLECIREVL